MPRTTEVLRYPRPAAPIWAHRVGWEELPPEAAAVFQKHAVAPGTLRSLVDRCTPQETGVDHMHFLGPDGAPVPAARAVYQLLSRREGVARRCISVVQILYAWHVARAMPAGRAPRLRRICDDIYCVNPLHYRQHGGESPGGVVRAGIRVADREALAAALCPTVRSVLEEEARRGDPVAQ